MGFESTMVVKCQPWGQTLHKAAKATLLVSTFIAVTVQRIEAQRVALPFPLPPASRSGVYCSRGKQERYRSTDDTLRNGFYDGHGCLGAW